MRRTTEVVKKLEGRSGTPLAGKPHSRQRTSEENELMDKLRRDCEKDMTPFSRKLTELSFNESSGSSPPAGASFNRRPSRTAFHQPLSATNNSESPRQVCPTDSWAIFLHKERKNTLLKRNYVPLEGRGMVASDQKVRIGNNARPVMVDSKRHLPHWIR